MPIIIRLQCGKLPLFPSRNRLFQAFASESATIFCRLWRNSAIYEYAYC